MLKSGLQCSPFGNCSQELIKIYGEKILKVKGEELCAGSVVVMCVPIFSGGSWLF